MCAYASLQLGFPADVDSVQFRALVSVPLNVCVILPLTLKRDLSSLAFVSMLTVVALTYTAVVLLVEMPQYHHEYYSSEAAIAAVTLDANLFQACSVTFFAYSCQFALFPVC